MKAIDHLTPDHTPEERISLQKTLWLYTMGMHDTLSILGQDKNIKNICDTLEAGFFISNR